MQAKLDTEDAKARCAKRQPSVEPVISIIKNAMGFVRFRLHGIKNVASERMLTALACNCRRLHRLKSA